MMERINKILQRRIPSKLLHESVSDIENNVKYNK